jgi:Prp8 binding protein
MDNTLRQWDVRPFVTGSRQVKVYQGATVRAPLFRCSLRMPASNDSSHQPHQNPNPNHQQHGSDRNLLRASWSADGEMVTAGSSDRAVHIFDVPTTQELYYLPGHKATVNEVVFSPVQPIIASASSDKTIYLGELA